MSHFDDVLIELAQNYKFLTRKQAEVIRGEMESGAGAAGELMLARHFLTQNQLTKLEAEAEVHAGGPDATQRLSPASVVIPPAAPRPIQVPSPAPAGMAPSPIAQPRPVAPAAPAAMPAPKPAPAAAPAPVAAPAPRPAAAVNPNGPRTLPDFLRLARHWGCSDLHLTVGRVPFVRLGGQIRYLEGYAEELTPERAEELNFSALSDRQAELARLDQSIDFSLELPGAQRYRCNMFKQRLGWDGSYRIVRDSIPTIEELNLPPVARTLTEYHQGMVLVTGPAGSGKTTTMAAMVDLVNRNRDDHIITIEDPIEYVHSPKRCAVTQREVGRHTESFARSLRAALREDPDIIMIGELRDQETISISISAAETGHLVFGSLHTSSAARTVSRILDVFPPAQQQQVCTMISESIRGVLSQQLVPRKDQKGVVLALEVLIFNSGVAQLVREGRTYQLQNQMQAGKKVGMKMMDEALMELFTAGVITGAEAYSRAENKTPFEMHKNS